MSNETPERSYMSYPPEMMAMRAQEYAGLERVHAGWFNRSYLEGDPTLAGMVPAFRWVQRDPPPPKIPTHPAMRWIIHFRTT